MVANDIVLLEEALRKIDGDSKIFPGIFPRLLYYSNLYSCGTDGKKEEFGEGFFMTFEKHDEKNSNSSYDRVALPLSNDGVCYIDVPVAMRRHPIVIDYIGGRFVRLG